MKETREAADAGWRCYTWWSAEKLQDVGIVDAIVHAEKPVHEIYKVNAIHLGRDSAEDRLNI